MIHLTTREHYEKYRDITAGYSPETLLGRTFQDWANEYDKDKRLNSVSLTEWDDSHRQFGTNMSQNVCSLKHVVIYNILKLKPVFTENP